MRCLICLDELKKENKLLFKDYKLCKCRVKNIHSGCYIKWCLNGQQDKCVICLEDIQLHPMMYYEYIINFNDFGSLDLINNNLRKTSDKYYIQIFPKKFRKKSYMLREKCYYIFSRIDVLYFLFLMVCISVIYIVYPYHTEQYADPEFYV